MAMFYPSSRRTAAPARGRHHRRLRASLRRRPRSLRPVGEGLEERSLLAVGLDPTWGFGGVSMPNVPADTATNTFDQRYSAIALQKNGTLDQVIEAGTLTTSPQGGGGSSTTQLIVSRLTTNGFLDPTFGSGGTATPTLPTQIGTPASNYTIDSVQDVRVDSNGRIDVLASATLTDSTGTDVGSDFLVIRLTPNGALDSSFGSAGIAAISFGAAGSPGAFASPSAMALGPVTAIGQKIDIVGTTSVTAPVSGTNVDPVFAVAQLTPNGQPDIRWGTAPTPGRVTIPVNPFGTTATDVADEARAVVVQADGNVVVGGSATNNSGPIGNNSSNPSDIVVMRLHDNNGSLDNTFVNTATPAGLPAGVVAFNQGFNGSTSTDSVSDLGLSGTTAGAQSIVVVGTSDQIFNQPPGPFTPSSSVLTVTRLTSAGAYDTTFNGSGKFNLPLAQGGVTFNTRGNAVLVGSDGSLLVGGTAREQNPGFGGPFTGVLLRLNSNGTRDSSYGTNGVALLPYSVDGRMLMQSDGKVVFYSGDVVRTTPPTPAAATTTIITTGTGKKMKASGVTITFNTAVNPNLLTSPTIYQVRPNGKRKLLKLKKRGGVSYNAATQTLTLNLAGKTAVGKGFQVVVLTSGIVGADGQVLPTTPIIITLPTT